MANVVAAAAVSETPGGPSAKSRQKSPSLWQQPVTNVEFYGVIFLMAMVFIWGMLKPGEIRRLGDPRKGSPPPPTASRITLSSGRGVAYREWGVAKDSARHTILAIHGTFECRHQGLPGVSEDLLREFGVRMVSYDRPGTAQSDGMNAWSYAYHVQTDIASLKSELGLTQPFWILAIDTGAPYAFHAAWQRPEWLAGIALLGPSGVIPAHPGMTEAETNQVASTLPQTYSIPYTITMQHKLIASHLLPVYFQQFVVHSAASIPKALQSGCGARDLATLRNETVARDMMLRMAEALGQRNGRALATEYLLQATPWHFSVADFLPTGEPPVKPELDDEIDDDVDTGDCSVNVEGAHCVRTHTRTSLPMHIWHGTEDVHAPIVLTQHLKRTLGDRIQIHILEGHGHFSYFYLCEECHRDILETLLGPANGPLPSPIKPTPKQEDPPDVNPTGDVRQCILQRKSSCDFRLPNEDMEVEEEEDDPDGF